MKSKLNNLENHLRATIRGQDHVIPRIADVLKQGELGLTGASEPKGSFLFMGPTGVGKTEITLSFTDYLYGKGHLHRFDMSDYKHIDYVREFDRRLGSVCDHHKHGVLLFDEMEKAHHDILMKFLQILSAARFTDDQDRVWDLRGFYMVFTSNIGATDIMASRHLNIVQIEKRMLLMLRTILPPEFGPRIKCKCVFQRLTPAVQAQIAEDVLNNEIQRIERDNGIVLSADSSVLPFLVQFGFDRINGARPVRDFTCYQVRKAVAEAVLSDTATGPLLLTRSSDQLVANPIT